MRRCSSLFAIASQVLPAATAVLESSSSSIRYRAKPLRRCSANNFIQFIPDYSTCLLIFISFLSSPFVYFVSPGHRPRTSQPLSKRDLQFNQRSTIMANRVQRPTGPQGRILQFKLVLLGESAVGKSSLVLRFVKGQFHEYQESTIGGRCSIGA